MEIKIYGGGCARCGELATAVSEVIAANGLAANLEKVMDYAKITARGVISTPALEVDGEIVASGRIPSREEISFWLGVAKAPCTCGCSCGAEKGSRGATIRKLVGWALLAFAVVALGAGFFGRPKSCSCTGEVVAESSAPSKTVTTVFYFHGSKRCMACNKIEAWTRAAVELSFVKELAGGMVVFKAVNLDEPENAHFVQDFQLAMRSVVVQRGTAFERLDQVWQLVRGDEAAFRQYITTGVRRHLGDAQ